MKVKRDENIPSRLAGALAKYAADPITARGLGHRFAPRFERTTQFQESRSSGGAGGPSNMATFDLNPGSTSLTVLHTMSRLTVR